MRLTKNPDDRVRLTAWLKGFGRRSVVKIDRRFWFKQGPKSMAYVRPTAALFKARFPEFTPVSNVLIDLVILEQEPQVGDTWVDADRVPALMFLVAHLLTLQGEPQRSIEIAAGGSGAGTLAGAMKRRKVGDVEVEYQNANERLGTGAGAATTAAGYELTAYGRQFRIYLRRNFQSMMVV